MARYLGVDLHRNNFTVCTIAENGRRYFREYDIRSLQYFAARLRPSDQVAVEVSTTTRLFFDAVAPHVDRVVVVNSSEFDVIRKSVKKTDRNDAETLALFLSKGLLPEVRMKDKLHADQQQDHAAEDLERAELGVYDALEDRIAHDRKAAEDCYGDQPRPDYHAPKRLGVQLLDHVDEIDDDQERV